jgi:hypothetical protein
MSETDVVSNCWRSILPRQRRRFPLTLPRGVPERHARSFTSEDGDLIVREGDYGHSAFMI